MISTRTHNLQVPSDHKSSLSQLRGQKVVAMGNCVSGSSLEENVFKVKNINDSRDLVQKGLMEVTLTELVYTDSATKENWHWPLKYLRKYGCDGDVFTFEAGRKCPGGEGLYAFSTRKASALFELVAKNINLGDLQPHGDASPFADSQALDASAVLSFPSPGQTGVPSTVVTTTDQPSYTNVDIMGKPLLNGGPSSLGNPAGGPANKPVYKEVIFEKPPEDHPKPETTTQKKTSYSKIDFEQTAKYNNRDARLGVASHQERAGSTSSHTHSSRHNGSSRSNGGRSRHNTYTSGNSRDRHKSESSYSSQSSLAESGRDVRTSRVNGSANNVASLDTNINTSMYQNVRVGGGASALQGGGATTPQESQQQYQNVSIGTGSVSQVFENSSPNHAQQQPNYCNITVSSKGQEGVSPDMTTSTNSVRLNGMGNYAQLDLSTEVSHMPRSMSSSAAPKTTVQSPQSQQQSSYLQLDFPSERTSSPTGTSHTHQSGRRSASVSGLSSSSEPKAAGGHKSPGIIHQHIPEETVVATPPSSAKLDGGSVKDPTKVEYEMLNFTAMKALEEFSNQREQEIEKEKEEREQKEKEKEKGKKKK